MPFRNLFNILRICAGVDQKKKKEKKKKRKGDKQDSSANKNSYYASERGMEEILEWKLGNKKRTGGKERERERNALLTKNKCKGLM